MAVVVWGKPRFTADIDIVVELVAEKIPLLTQKLLLVDKDVYADEGSMKDALLRKGEFNFIHPQSGLKVDFWIVKDDSFDKLRINNPVQKVIKGQKINFISPEDLILSKLLWYKESQSVRHLEDIKSILRISKPDLDYIKKWAQKHSTLEILNKLL